MEDVDATAVFSVEKVVDSSIGKDNRRYYKVKWADSWEPEENLEGCKKLVDAYWEEVFEGEKNGSENELYDTRSRRKRKKKHIRSEKIDSTSAEETIENSNGVNEKTETCVDLNSSRPHKFAKNSESCTPPKINESIDEQQVQVKEEPDSDKDEDGQLFKRTAKLKASFVIRKYLEKEGNDVVSDEDTNDKNFDITKSEDTLSGEDRELESDSPRTNNLAIDTHVHSIHTKTGSLNEITPSNVTSHNFPSTVLTADQQYRQPTPATFIITSSSSSSIVVTTDLLYQKPTSQSIGPVNHPTAVLNGVHSFSEQQLNLLFNAVLVNTSKIVTEKPIFYPHVIHDAVICSITQELSLYFRHFNPNKQFLDTQFLAFHEILLRKLIETGRSTNASDVKSALLRNLFKHSINNNRIEELLRRYAGDCYQKLSTSGRIFPVPYHLHSPGDIQRLPSNTRSISTNRNVSAVGNTGTHLPHNVILNNLQNTSQGMHQMFISRARLPPASALRHKIPGGSYPVNIPHHRPFVSDTRAQRFISVRPTSPTSDVPFMVTEVRSLSSSSSNGPVSCQQVTTTSTSMTTLTSISKSRLKENIITSASKLRERLAQKDKKNSIITKGNCSQTPIVIDEEENVVNDISKNKKNDLRFIPDTGVPIHIRRYIEENSAAILHYVSQKRGMIGSKLLVHKSGVIEVKLINGESVNIRYKDIIKFKFEQNSKVKKTLATPSDIFHKTGSSPHVLKNLQVKIDSLESNSAIPNNCTKSAVCKTISKEPCSSSVDTVSVSIPENPCNSSGSKYDVNVMHKIEDKLDKVRETALNKKKQVESLRDAVMYCLEDNQLQEILEHFETNIPSETNTNTISLDSGDKDTTSNHLRKS